MPEVANYDPVLTSDIKVLIPQSSSLSKSVDLSGTTLVGYIMPDAWDDAKITLQMSCDNKMFYDVYDQFGNEVMHNAAVGRYVSLAPADTAGMRYIRLRSGTSLEPVNQQTQCTFTLITRVL